MKFYQCFSSHLKPDTRDCELCRRYLLCQFTQLQWPDSGAVVVKLFNLLDSGHLNMMGRLSLKDALINLGGPEMERQDILPWPRGS